MNKKEKINTTRADKIINTKAWRNDTLGLLTNRVIRILIEDGATETEAYKYLEMD